jgi:transposase
MRAERARLSRHAETAKAIDHMLTRRVACTRFLDDGRIGLSNNAAEHALRGIAMRPPLCRSSSSLWKHWKLVWRRDATRATCSRNRGKDMLGLQVGASDLIQRPRHDLLSGKDAVADQSPDAVVRDPERRGGLRHLQPFAVLLCVSARTVRRRVV